MKVSARIDRDIFGPSGGRRYLWVRLDAPRRPTSGKRPPLDIALVLDRSGSMSGGKIELARRACLGVTQLLRETDRCALAAYDEEIITPVPAGRPSSNHGHTWRYAERARRETPPKWAS